MLLTKKSFSLILTLFFWGCELGLDCKTSNESTKNENFYIVVSFKERKGRHFLWEGIDSLGKKTKFRGMSAFHATITDSLEVGDTIVKFKGKMELNILKRKRKVSLACPFCIDYSNRNDSIYNKQ